MPGETNDLEVKIALELEEQLNQYKCAQTQQERDALLEQSNKTDGAMWFALTKCKFTPDEVIARIYKALSLNQYRPKNQNIRQFILHKDLNYVNGAYCTFDAELSKMFKNNECEKIYDYFKRKLYNAQIMIEQFSNYWLESLRLHKDLVDAARNSDETNFVKFYNTLFKTLNKDFCKKYRIRIHPKAITDWAETDRKIENYPVKPDGLQCLFSTKNHKQNYFILESNVYVNIKSIKEQATNADDVFNKIITAFVHEMHHALDCLAPRQGMLGSQVHYIDEVLWRKAKKDDKKAYYSEATERSSYSIERYLLNKLKEKQI